MKLENARMKQEMADMKLEINTSTFGLRCFAGSDDDLDSRLVFQVTLL